MRWNQFFGLFLLSMLILFGGLLPSQALAANGYADFTMKRTLQQADQASNNTRWIEVPGRGPMLFYAQTNPFWDRMRYEVAGSPSMRRFGDGGCCPTSAAIAFVNLLSVTELGKIRPYAATRATGYGFSTASINPLNLQRMLGVLWLDYAEDYQRYLPLAFGQYAVGNNSKNNNWRAKPREWQVSTGGTGIGFVPDLCAIYGLQYTKYPGKMNLDWIESVRNGATAIALANSQWQPFVNSDGHYVVIVAVDEEYLYIMDPQDKPQEKYTHDRNSVLEVVENGFLRVKLSDYQHLHLGMIYVITNAEVDAKLARLGLASGEP